jgi:hypothetical protein
LLKKTVGALDPAIARRDPGPGHSFGEDRMFCSPSRKAGSGNPGEGLPVQESFITSLYGWQG